MNKSDLYEIKAGDTGETVANGLKQNFESIVDAIGDVDTLLDELNGETAENQQND